VDPHLPGGNLVQPRKQLMQRDVLLSGEVTGVLLIGAPDV
jgi:hypothetical protein